MSVQVSYKKQFVFGILAILVLFLVVEGSVRVFEWSQNSPSLHILGGISDCNSYFFGECKCKFLGSSVMQNVSLADQQQVCSDYYNLEFTYDPYLSYFPNQTYPTLTINSFGLRGAEFELPKPQNVFRIIMIGGSTTFGAGAISDDTTIPAILEKKLNEKNFEKHIEVINGGIPGSFSTTEIHRLKNTYLNFEPDMIIVYGGWNDALKKELRGKTNEERIEKYLEDKDPITSFFSKNLRHISSLELLYSYIFPQNNYSLNETQIKQNAEAWQNNWIDVCQDLNKQNIDVVIALQPIAGHPKKLTMEEEQMIDSETKSITKIIDVFSETLPMINNSCTETIDLRTAFSNVSSSVYYDEGHMSVFGNTIIANNLESISTPIIKNSIN